jgi:hypothetical protein
MTSNSIRQKAEKAVYTYLRPHLTKTCVGDNTVTSDQSADLPQKPFVVIVAETFEEISPMSGVFKVSVRVTFSSYVAETSPDEREAAVTAINNFTYSDPATEMSQLADFYCHGVVPTSGEMTVDTEEKAYDYNVNFEMWCMPRDNT